MKASRRASHAEIDWQELHARLAQVAVTTRAALQPSPERAAMVLEERARRLAQPLAVARSSLAALDVLVFMLSGECHCIETRYVQEVVRFGGLTPVPGVSDVVAGLANLHGQILVVFDLRRLFGLAAQDVTDASRIVVCGDPQPDLGLLADSVSDVVCLPTEAILADGRSEDRRVDNPVRGITRDAMIVLDGSALVTDRRLFLGQASRQ
jgi:purine-binding chemotaxis protein CheW